MNNNNRKPLPHQPSPKQVKWIRIWRGLKGIITSRIGNILTVLVLVIDIIAYKHYHTLILNRNDMVQGYSLKGLETALLIALILLIDIALFMISIMPVRAQKHSSIFRSVGLYNKLFQTPDLLSRTKDSGMEIYEYYVSGISVNEFEKVLPEMETAFNRSILYIREGKTKNRVLVYMRKTGIPSYVLFDDEYLSPKESEIVLGICGDGLKKIDLDKSPMVFSGGETGSGKTVLMKVALYQAYEHHNKIYLYDGKGFVDFSSYEINRYECISEKEMLLQTLKQLVTELNHRTDLLNEQDCRNIAEYNEQNTSEPMQRIILATDEVGEMFNKKGLKRAEKELVENIEKEMDTIARLGRAFGIHLWLSTQRGDADTIPPQIRSNLTYRVCGKASDVLSRLTIGNGLATEIRANQKGRFVDNSGDFFQAFDFKEPDSQ